MGWSTTGSPEDTVAVWQHETVRAGGLRTRSLMLKLPWDIFDVPCGFGLASDDCSLSFLALLH